MHCPRLTELPPPPAAQTGWPWTEESPPLPDKMPDGRDWPRISVVTPNFNYGRFLEETIRSVLLQGYPNLEYVVTDGGSTDESVAIIRQYEPWLAHWESSPDGGQTHAINKGLKFCSGEIFNWVNSDDHLMPGALETVARIFAAESPDLILGRMLRLYTGETGDFYSGDVWVPVAPRSVYDLIKHGQLGLGIGQPSAFMKLDRVREVGGVREEMHFCFDWLLYLDILLSRRGRAHVQTTTHALSRQRIHPEAKTVKSSPSFGQETKRFIPELLPKCRPLDRLKMRWWLRRFETRDHVSALWNNNRVRLPELARLALQRPDALLLRCYWGSVKSCFIG
jgi:glycosyltransferase involved in cell wall biosynthesis